MSNTKANIKKGKKMKLIDVPEDVQKIIIERQEQEMQLCECERPQQHAIYKIIREHHKMTCCGPVFGLDGVFAEVNPVITLENQDIVLILRIPSSSAVGMALNYKRIGSQEEKSGIAGKG